MTTPSGLPTGSETEHPSVGFYRRLLVFYPPRYAMTWMMAPHKLFDWWSPLYAIEHGRASEVDAEINRMESGAYV